MGDKQVVDKTLRVQVLRLGKMLLILAVIALLGCGSDQSQADELAREHEIEMAREQAAKDAVQSHRIRQLEEELEKARDSDREIQEPAHLPLPLIFGGWPEGDGYTAIIGSFTDEEDALDRQIEAAEKGLDAGILWSSDYSSLKPEYWVVYSGVYETSTEAEARAARARELGYEDAYPRYVRP